MIKFRQVNQWGYKTIGRLQKTKKGFILLFILSVLSFAYFPVQAQQISFTVVTGTPFENIYYSSVAFADVDGDNDADVLISGKKLNGDYVTNLYTNDGTGGYTLVSGTPFEPLVSSDIAFADIDADNDLDVLIIGSNSSSTPIAKLYTNNGSGTFTEVASTPFIGVYSGSISFADIDGDNDSDVLITGSQGVNQRSTQLYKNNGSGSFSVVNNASITELALSSSDFADIDGDGDMDLLISGESFYLFPNSLSDIKLYKNNGSGTFTEVSSTAFEAISSGNLEFADIDGDNDEDVVITGNGSSSPSTKLYTNDGNGNFTAISAPFTNLFYSCNRFADIEGDGDLDMMITGNTGVTISSSFPPHADLYINDGSGNFSIVSGLPFEGVGLSATDLADIDGDGDIDVLLSGKNSNLQVVTRLYRNTSCSPSSIDSTITQLNDTTLKANATGNYSYQWIDCNNGNSPITGDTNQTFVGSANGSYAVIITSSDGCSITTDCFDLNGGGNNNGIKTTQRHSLQVYPNPTKRMFTIKLPQEVSKMPLAVYSPLGRLIYKNIVSGNKVNIDLKNYPAGIYIIRLNNNNNIKVIKY